MTNPFLNFQKFYDREAAADMVSHLENNHIPVELEDSESFFDVTFANNPLQKTIWLKVKSADMVRAEDALHVYYQKKLDLVPPDYYLFDFSDEQLIEIVRRPDEWGFLDYPLAIRILNDRGISISKDEISKLNEQRIEVVTKPEDISPSYIWLGYLVSIIFWPGGLMSGGIMTFMKKSVFNGARVYAYSTKDRKHGQRIIMISTLLFVIWIFRYFLL
jgi:hypothetical protein